MTTVSTSPSSGAVAADSNVSTAPAVTSAEVRRLGIPLVVGALTWSLTSSTIGVTPSTSLGVTVQDLSGLAFQAGVMCLVVLQLRTAATGSGRGARALLRVEQVLLSLAMLWSVLHGALPGIRDAGWLVPLDLFWPLSMLGMFVIAVKVALTGRWRGLARWWPLVAESWVVVTLPAMAIGGAAVGQLVGSAHLVLGYTALGVLLVARPHLVGARG